MRKCNEPGNYAGDITGFQIRLIDNEKFCLSRGNGDLGFDDTAVEPMFDFQKMDLKNNFEIMKRKTWRA